MLAETHIVFPAADVADQYAADVMSGKISCL